MQPISYKHHRFPPEIIRFTAYLYRRFDLSFREVEELLAERGVRVSYETVRCWTLKMEPVEGDELRYGGRPTDHWRLDEMAARIGQHPVWLWRAINDDEAVVDLLVQRERDVAGASETLRGLVRRQVIWSARRRTVEAEPVQPHR